VGIGVRLNAELNDEQRQRQQVNDQAAMTSEQGSNLRGGKYPPTSWARQRRGVKPLRRNSGRHVRDGTIVQRRDGVQD
jgi:hypothetical protein